MSVKIRLQRHGKKGKPFFHIVAADARSPRDGKFIERELMLVKVKATGAFREEMKRMCDIFRGRIIDVADGSFTIELTGSGNKLDAFIESLDKAAILETVRTGASGIGRGDRILKV